MRYSQQKVGLSKPWYTLSFLGDEEGRNLEEPSINQPGQVESCSRRFQLTRWNWRLSLSRVSSIQINSINCYEAHWRFICRRISCSSIEDLRSSVPSKKQAANLQLRSTERRYARLTLHLSHVKPMTLALHWHWPEMISQLRLRDPKSLHAHPTEGK